jgi:hypothetical protein
MNPIINPAGDEYFTQQNMIALSMLASQGPKNNQDIPSSQS